MLVIIPKRFLEAIKAFNALKQIPFTMIGFEREMKSNNEIYRKDLGEDFLEKQKGRIIDETAKDQTKKRTCP